MNDVKTHWAGIDVSKDVFDISIVFEHQHHPETPLVDVPAETFMRTASGVRQALKWLDIQLGKADESGKPIRAVMEATGKYSLELTALLVHERPDLRPAIINPKRGHDFIESLGVRGKTDSMDARGLGFYGVERRPAEYEPQAPDLAELREMNRFRDFLVAQKVAQDNRMDDVNQCKEVQKIARRRKAQIERDIKKIEAEMKALVSCSPDLKRDVYLLTTIPGIAFLSACTILAELGDLRRFERSRQATAFAGMCPKEYQSGSSIHRKTRLSKVGNARVRQSLYMSAITAARVAGPLCDDYNRKLREGKERMVAPGMVMRKLLVMMRAILISGLPYDKNYRTCGKPCGKVVE